VPDIVSILEGHEIVLVQSSADVSKTDMLKSRELIKRLSEDHGISKVLIDTTNLLSLPNAFDLFEFVTSTSRVLRRIDKLAIVSSTATGEDLKFIETVALHRGLHTRIVDSIPEAIAWLAE